MNQVERLIRNYEEQVSVPWSTGLAGPQKVWFAVYDKADERRIRARIDEFKLATLRAKHGWVACDLTDCFAEWMAAQEYREAYFAAPDDLTMALGEFKQSASTQVQRVLRGSDEDTVVALAGVGCLFGLMRVSDLVTNVHQHVRGRLLVLFPGSYEGNTYRLLDARDGWNYLAVPITAYSGGATR